jgi:beta-lactamase class A
MMNTGKIRKNLYAGAFMQSKRLWWILGGLGILFILSSLFIITTEYQRYKSNPVVFPEGSIIAGVPVGGVDKASANKRLSDVYTTPILLELNGQRIIITPEALGFQMEPASLVERAVDQVQNDNFWTFIWGSAEADAIDIPLDASLDDERTLAYLSAEIIPRYINSDAPARPIHGTTNFMLGSGGQSLNFDHALVGIQEALFSTNERSVTLQTIQVEASSPTMDTLKAFLQHNVDLVGFDTLAEIYLESMDSGETLHFALQDGQIVKPGIAFSAASTIKIPIMISVLRRTTEPTPDEILTLFEGMIVASDNPPADTLMETYLDPVRGPLIVSEDLADLGMENSFLAGYFYLGAPVLQLFETQANTRTDIFLDPDIYNQTVPGEAGQLLSAIYTCAQDGGGLLTETFGEEITPNECQLMIDVLAKNRIGALIEAGLPPQASIAHKHGWVQELDGLLHTMSDVAIVFTPGGDYVLNIFIYDPIRLDFDQGNRLFARVSQTVYNFFNIEEQAYWWFD